MELSVVIPVYNQEKIIRKTLGALFNQSIQRNTYEIIVVDDGSTDDTKKVLQVLQKETKEKLILFKTAKKRGRGSARNLGIKRAGNKIVVLLDGDIIASKTLLAEHQKWHKRFPKENFAMIGYTTWSPEINITPFMYWLEHGGRQLDFDDLKPGREVDYKHFYTGNASLKRDFLIKNGLFDEDFGRELYEDLELAFRLGKKGLKIFYNKEAAGYHFHLTNPEMYAKRMLGVGRGARILFKKHPGLKDKIALSKFTPRTILNQLFSPICFLIGKIFRSQRWMGYYYNAIFFRKYMEGYKKSG